MNCARLTSVLVLAGLLVPGADLARGDRPGTKATDPRWRVETIDADTNVGRHLSMAHNADHGITVISYHDADHGYLKLAATVPVVDPPSMNCGPGDTWSCDLIDIGGVGQYSAAATVSETWSARFLVAYYDATHGALERAGFACNATGCGVKWMSTIDVGDPATSVFKGKPVSAGMDTDLREHVAYFYEDGSAADAQRYAHWAPGNGNCGDGFRQCDVIDEGEGVGRYTSLDLDGSDRPAIAYYDAAAGYPIVASYRGANGNCGPANAWLCRSVQQSGLDTGQHVALDLNAGGVPRMAYRNATEDKLEYATYVGGGGNCGFSSQTFDYEWHCEVVDDMGPSIDDKVLALAHDAAGHPVIAYQFAPDDRAPAALKVAQPIEAVIIPVAANCGPDEQNPTWYCGFVARGSAYIDLAASVALAVEPSGRAIIAYHELDSFQFPAKGTLKIATAPLGEMIFRDSFES